METTPVPNDIKYDADGKVIGWTNAFGTYELDAKGITKRVGDGNVFKQ